MLNEDISTTESQTSDLEFSHSEISIEENIWASLPPEIFNPVERKARTWEQFRDKDFEDDSIYLSEATPRVWDAVWSAELNDADEPFPTKDGAQGAIIQFQDAIQELCHLALGFTANASVVDRQPKLTNISGISSTLTLSLIQDFGTIGATFQAIEAFAKRTSSGHNFPQSTVAVAAAFERISRATRSWLIERASRPRSVLQLQALFKRPGLLLKNLQQLIDELYKLHSDIDVINHIFRFTEEQQFSDGWWRPLTLHILRLVSQPYLDSVGRLIGLGHSSPVCSRLEGTPQSALKVEQEPQFPHALPEFFLEEQMKLITASWQGLKLIEAHDENNVLANATPELPSLELRFTLDDIERIQRKASHYEVQVRSLTKATLPRSPPAEDSSLNETSEDHCFNPFGENEEQILENIFRSYDVFGNPKESPDCMIKDAIEEAVRSALDSDATNEHEGVLLPLSIMAANSLAPLISTQSRLVNLACLKTLFEKYDLIHHLDLQYDFQLLGSGIFASRLSQALLSPDLSSAERKKGHARAGTMGLRLGSRTTWPPASAEIRLALMGILVECYKDCFPERSVVKTDDLPGDMSFAIRNLPENEIQACLNPDSLEALDFLRLQYRASSPLDAVITETALEKYNRVFRFLLRLQRVSFLVNHLLPLKATETKTGSGKLRSRFIVEARHFVRSLSMYTGTYIASGWIRFRRCIQSISERLQDPNYVDQVGEVIGLHQLRQLHEAMLDRILFDLLLKRRQQKVMEVLSEIMAHLVDFARLDNETASSLNTGETADAFKRFRAKVNLFRAVCKGLCGRSDYLAQAKVPPFPSFTQEWKGNDTDEQGLSSLLLMLDMNGWYEKLEGSALS